MSQPSDPTARFLVIGIGADGLLGLGERVRQRVADAHVVVGGTRHVAMLEPRDAQIHRVWPTPLRSGLRDLAGQFPGHEIVVLASGDPLLSGVGTTLIDEFGVDAVRIIPAVSSAQLARARMGWSAESSDTVSVVARPLEVVLRYGAPGGRLIVLSSDETTPRALAALLTSHGWGESRLTVLADLGADTEQRMTALAREFDAEVGRLNVVCVEFAGSGLASWSAGLPDEAFENDGQLTKRDMRASALARLAPAPGQLLWDVGAGAGSVGIEWMRAHRSCRTIAIEADPVRAARIRRNANALAVPGLQVVEARAPQSLDILPKPDAIFVGGGVTSPGLVEVCIDALLPGGRIVIHGVTLEAEQIAAERYGRHGGELTRIGVERAAPIGSFTGWSPARTVTQWAWTKPL